MKKISRFILTSFVTVPGLLIAQAPIARFSASDTSICSNSYVENFTDLSTNNPSHWKWYFPGAMPDTSTLQNPTNITYNGYGCYTVKLVVKNNSGSDSLTDSNYICLYAMPHVNIKIADSGHICQGDTNLVTIMASGGMSYHWSTGQTTSTINLIPPPPPGFTLTVKVSNGPCFTDTTLAIIVDTMPKVGFKGDTSICVGKSTTMYVLNEYGYTFLWSTGSTADSIIVNGVTPGSYKYYVTITKGTCIKDSVPITVRVHTCAAGIEDYSDPLEIKILPNPSNGRFTLTFNTPVNGTIEIYDITGQRVYQQTLQSETTEINLSGQPAGMYFYRVITNTGSLIGEGKVVIQK